MNKTISGHIAALITILIWGTTFISTKILLAEFTPMEVLFFRFLLGLILLSLIYPKRLKLNNIKQEFTFAAAGLCGICLYYLFENIALTYTLASNVGVIISIAPFFTAILSHIFMKSDEKLKVKFFVGFLVAITGICLVSFNDKTFEINPIGDILSIVAAVVWSFYSLLTRKISNYGYNIIQATRRIFVYGIIFMIPFLFVFNFNLDFKKFINTEYILNFLYLGIGASALCFVTWNYAVKKLGAVKTSVYIYIVPIITVATSVIVLDEKITLVSVLGTVLTLTGLFLSESKIKFKKRGNEYARRE